MYFVGREKEIERVKEALEEGKNVIVSGKYGIGRTSLIKHVAETMQQQWQFLFLDFSRTPGKLCGDLVARLWPEKRRSGKDEFSRYRSARFRIASLDFIDHRRHVLVLDNIAKLSHQKIDFIRYLTWEKRFQFVSIAESFLSSNDLFRLRVRMDPVIVITLHHLSASEVSRFYRQLSREHQLGWTEGRIRNLTEVTGGYPLRMKEIALREIGQRATDRSVYRTKALRPA